MINLIKRKNKSPNGFRKSIELPNILPRRIANIKAIKIYVTRFNLVSNVPFPPFKDFPQLLTTFFIHISNNIRITRDFTLPSYTIKKTPFENCFRKTFTFSRMFIRKSFSQLDIHSAHPLMLLQSR